jgi:hypothetical protein
MLLGVDVSRHTDWCGSLYEGRCFLHRVDSFFIEGVEYRVSTNACTARDYTSPVKRASYGAEEASGRRLIPSRSRDFRSWVIDHSIPFRSAPRASDNNYADYVVGREKALACLRVAAKCADCSVRLRPIREGRDVNPRLSKFEASNGTRGDLFAEAFSQDRGAVPSIPWLCSRCCRRRTAALKWRSREMRRVQCVRRQMKAIRSFLKDGNPAVFRSLPRGFRPATTSPG